MSETYHVVAADATTFIEKFYKAVKDGYRLTAENEFWPIDNNAKKSVFMFKNPAMPVHKEKMGLKFKEVQHYCRFEFLKLLQQAIIEGYKPDFEKIMWKSLKYVAFQEKAERAKPGPKAKEPKQQEE